MISRAEPCNDRNVPTRPPRPPTDEAIDQDRVYERLDYLVNYKGVVTTSVPMVHTLFCPMFFRDFPFDTQECTFTVGSWIYNGHEVNILPWTDSDGAGAPVDLSEYEKELEAEFVLKRVVSQHVTKQYGVTKTPYPTIEFKIVLQRDATVSYFSAIILPLICVTYAGFLAFLVRGEPASERECAR